MPTLFTVLMLIGAFLSWFVPETNRCKLPETSAEANVRRYTDQKLIFDTQCGFEGLSF